MPLTHLLLLILVFFATSMVSVVTGSTSLITVPAMLHFSIDPKTALATNMFALTFVSVGASLPLGKSGAIDKQRLPVLVSVTVVGSVLGSLLLVLVSARFATLVVPVEMIGMAVFSVFCNPTELARTVANERTCPTRPDTG